MVFSNAGPNLLENHKAAKPALNVGRSLLASEPPFKWHFAGWLLMTAYSGICIVSPLIILTKNRCQGWSPSDKEFWIRARIISKTFNMPFRSPDESTLLKTIILISQPKHMLWVLKRTASKRRFF